jgi:hypothetical protein
MAPPSTTADATTLTRATASAGGMTLLRQRNSFSQQALRREVVAGPGAGPRAVDQRMPKRVASARWAVGSQRAIARSRCARPAAISPPVSEEIPMIRCAIRRGAMASCCSASERNSRQLVGRPVAMMLYQAGDSLLINLPHPCDDGPASFHSGDPGQHSRDGGRACDLTLRRPPSVAQKALGTRLG